MELIRTSDFCMSATLCTYLIGDKGTFKTLASLRTVTIRLSVASRESVAREHSTSSSQYNEVLHALFFCISDNTIEVK